MENKTPDEATRAPRCMPKGTRGEHCTRLMVVLRFERNIDNGHDDDDADRTATVVPTAPTVPLFNVTFPTGKVSAHSATPYDHAAIPFTVTVVLVKNRSMLS